jgi:hypothetical protein
MTTPAPSPVPANGAGRARAIGIASLIVAFFLQLPALVGGIIALLMSRSAGEKNGFAVAAIVVSIVLGAIWLTVGGLAIAGFFGQIFDKCAELGNGTHVVDGTTYTCNL